MRILSVGDSWCAGVWDVVDDKHTLVDEGYQKIVKKHAKIKTCYGFSNREAVQNVIKYHKKFDLVLFFVTDPFRDLSNPDANHSFFIKEILTANELLTAHRVLLESTIQSLNAIDADIRLIGGCQSLNHRSEDNIIIPCVSDLVSNKEYTHPFIWDSGWSSFLNFSIFSNSSRDLMKLLVKNRQQQNAMESEPFQKYFWPDGYHPNANSHIILGNEIVKNITSK